MESEAGSRVRALHRWTATSLLEAVEVSKTSIQMVGLEAACTPPVNGNGAVGRGVISQCGWWKPAARYERKGWQRWKDSLDGMDAWKEWRKVLEDEES